MKTGSCLCGGTAFELHGELEPIVVCHCTQCRKQSGNYWASTKGKTNDLHFTRQDTLSWYRASPQALRGFCRECGSNLFWRGDGSDKTSVCAGAIDGATGLKIAGHIYCDDAGDYYEIVGGDYKLPQW